VRLANQASAVEKLLRKYRDIPIVLADACLIDLADQMHTGQILSLDHDFEIYQWRSRRKFELLFELS
jgi:predicted nucleic acid-binding protein